MGRIPQTIGLMSGTSMEGADAMLIESDGETVSKRAEGLLRP